MLTLTVTVVTHLYNFLSAMITYITIAVIEHMDMGPTSLVMAVTQSFLAFKYALAMAFFARKYSKTLQQEYGLVE